MVDEQYIHPEEALALDMGRSEMQYIHPEIESGSDEALAVVMEAKRLLGNLVFEMGAFQLRWESLERTRSGDGELLTDLVGLPDQRLDDVLNTLSKDIKMLGAQIKHAKEAKGFLHSPHKARTRKTTER